MEDNELRTLIDASKDQAAGSLDTPPAASLQYLSTLDLSDDDLELLLGDAPGLSWTDMKKDTASFFYRLRMRSAQLICNDQDLKESVHKAFSVGSEAGWVALVGAFGFGPTTLVAAALKPIAAALVASGVKQLCVTRNEAVDP